MTLAGLTIGYRLDTATADGTTSQGRDQTYALPPLALRVISLVPGGARDIRDSTAMTFADLDARRFRARSFGMAGWFFYALAAGVAALGLASLYRTLRAPAGARAVPTISNGAVLKAAARSLSEVAREKQGQGWTDALVARAGAALRIIGSYAIGRPAVQTRGVAANLRGGQIALSQGLVRRRHALVSAAVTPRDLTATAASDPAVQQVHDGLVALTASRFGRASLDESALDAAVNAGGPLARSLGYRHSWPATRWRKMKTAVTEWKGRA